MSQQAKSTLEEIAWKLAGLETDCPSCKQASFSRFWSATITNPIEDTCGGTGKVKLLPMLSQPCPHCFVEGHPWLNDQIGLVVPCHLCRGDSYIPIPPSEGIALDGLETSGITSLHIMKDLDDYLINGWGNGRHFTGEGTTRTEALYSLLWKVVQTRTTST